MKTVVYYALFEEDKDGNIAVTFPDIFGGVTCGENEEDAFAMAADLLKMMLKEAPAQCEPPASYEKMRSLFPNKRIEKIEVEL